MQIAKNKKASKQMNKGNARKPKEFANHQEMKQTFGDIIGLITCKR